MPSPFPGMNPFLEQEDAWHDFHESFMPYARELLEAQVGPAYIVKIDSHVYIHDVALSERQYLGRADVSLARRHAAQRPGMATAVLEAPVQVAVPVSDVERESYLEIRDRQSRELISVVELLSPSNKRPGKDREQYLFKRGQILASPAHLVEIDLLRGGRRMPVDNLPDCHYCILVSRAETRPAAGLWALNLRKRLPEIPVPLRAPDLDARLDLQVMIHRLYDAANYGKYIYQQSPEPRLSQADAKWARRFIPQRTSPEE